MVERRDGADVGNGSAQVARPREADPKGQKKVVYTDFEDELGDSTAVELPQVTAGLNMSKFREKARQFLKAHESHLSLQRLRRNQPLTASDLMSWSGCWCRPGERDR